jgi:hypothetical protein
MITASLEGIADLVIRRAQRQGFILAREIREELTNAGVADNLWKDVVAIARSALHYHQGRYYYRAPVSPRVARAQSQQRAIQKTIRQVVDAHRKAHDQAERRGEDRIDFIQPVTVVTEDQRSCTMLTRDVSATGIRLIGTRRFLGQKVRVLVPNPASSTPWNFLVHILWTAVVGDDLVENGGAFLEVETPEGA